MAGNTIGEAWVTIRPDTSGFESALTQGTASSLKNFAPKILLAFAAVSAGVVVTAVKLATQFNTSLSAIDARMGITTAAGKAIGDAFLSTAGKVTFSATTIAAAFAPVSGQLDLLNKGALTANQSLGFMTAAMAAAEATGQPLADVTAALANVMVAYHLPLKDAAMATDILTNASMDLNLPISDVASTVDRMAGKLGSAVPPLADVTTLMVELTQSAVPARQAVTDAAAAITSLLDPSTKGAADIKELHLKTLDANGSFVGMQSVITQLHKPFEDMTKAQQLQTATLLFGKPAAEAMIAVILKGPAPYEALAQSVSKAGSAQDKANTATSNLAGAWAKIKSDLSDMLTSFGNLVTPLVQIAAKNALPAINEAFKIMASPPISTILPALLIGIVGSFTLFKAIAVGGEIVKMIQFIAAGSTSAGMAEFGAASTAAFAPWLLAVAPITAIAAAIMSVRGVQPGKSSPGNPFGLTVPGMPNSNTQVSSGGVGGFIGWLEQQAKRFGFRASGGAVFAGMPTWVGEQGKELFVPETNGRIISNGNLPTAQKGLTQVNNFYGVGKETIELVDQRIQKNNRNLQLVLRAH